MKPFYKLLLSAALISPLFSLAQSNYKPGYVVIIKGDTLKGFINIKEWNVNPRSISFKTAIDKKESRNLGVNDITFFKADSYDAYQRYIGLLNDDPTSVATIPTGRNTSTITDSVFLQVAQKGPNITLYSYTDNKKDHFFVSDRQDTEPKELVYRIYYNEDNKTVNENGYMQQLYLLAQKYNSNNDKLKTSIEKAYYTYNELVGISRKINNTTEKADRAEKGNRKGAVFFAGIGLNAATVSTSAPIVLASANPTAQLFPRIDAGVNIFSNPSTGKLIFRAEAAYTVNKYKENFSSGSSSGSYSFNQNTISLIPQIMYNFYNTDDFKVYAAVGASFNLSGYSGNNSSYTSGGTTNVRTNILSLEKNWTSFVFKAGTTINKKFDIAVAYLPNATFTNTFSYYAQVKAIQLSLNYNFY
ncbi:hypothetical protein [Mucilaginibacter dorajii]|uniref:Outer membrane protein beta-barrel domain-containing protein n=1 Tax=Mucilaginibacter dorajii TaxID=692994 RepID=A0ABP7QFG6_9SPHI|nr:hypothetical protein [Mucilaginibacter dorajii]MCS3733344.1 hypothetical protein [Mucilaginibacter dorajii]